MIVSQTPKLPEYHQSPNASHLSVGFAIPDPSRSPYRRQRQRLELLSARRKIYGCQVKLDVVQSKGKYLSHETPWSVQLDKPIRAGCTRSRADLPQLPEDATNGLTARTEGTK